MEEEWWEGKINMTLDYVIQILHILTGILYSITAVSQMTDLKLFPPLQPVVLHWLKLNTNFLACCHV